METIPLSLNFIAGALRAARIGFVAAVSATTLWAASAHAQTYNSRTEYALTQGGTTGVWRYGYTTNDVSNAFVPFSLTKTGALCGSTEEVWRFSTSGDEVPVMARFNSPSGCAGVPPDSLFIHPGNSGERAVLRWVAPAAGTYQLTGALQRANPVATTDLRILQNETTSLYTANINSVWQQAFNVTVTVATNDTIDFSVGYGNGSYNSDSTALNVTVSLPPSSCLTAPANLQVNVPAENSPVDVQSLNTNGSLVGDATYTNLGKVGRAFSFDGNGDYVRIEDNAAQRPANAVTAEGWFKFSSQPGGAVSLISKPLRNTALNSYTLYLDGGQLRGLVGSASQYTRVFSNFTPQPGVWHHLAFTFDYTGGVSTLRLFANGVEITSGQDGTPNLPITYDANPYPLLIGGEFENNAPTFFLDGQADEVSVYGRALSQPEIFNIVQQGSFGKCPPPVQNPAPPFAVSAPANQTAWFTGDGDGRDFTGLNSSGTLQGDTKFRLGRVGQAFSFDGNGDYVEIPDGPAQKPANQLTIEGWFNLESVGGIQVLVAKQLRDSVYSSYTLYLADGKIWIGYFDVAQNWVFLDTGYRPALGTWTHYAFVIDTDDSGPTANTMKLFVNGVESGSVPADNPIFYNGINDTLTPYPLLIGGAFDNNNTQYYLNGRADEVSLYSRALSGSEIAAVYNAGAAGKSKKAATASGSNVPVQLSDATVTFASVSAAGTTAENGIDLGLLPPLPSNVAYTGLAYDISTTAAYQNGRRNDVRVCFNLPALANFAFSRLRILHLENGVWVNRTDRNSAPGTLCTNNVRSLSPFIIVEAQAALGGITDKLTAEDTPLSFTFDIGDPTGVTEVTAESGDPSVIPNDAAHLSVSGTGATRTLNVVPAADQWGKVPITITVRRGSETLTDFFAVTVTEVNDVPVAQADSLSPIAEDSGVRTIPFASLLSNDSTGPANESGQTLLVSSVNNPVGGTVSISGTSVLFAPAADFNGPASFSYTAQDNGQTDGTNDFQTSAPVTVSFIVTEVNDVPIAAADSLSAVLEDSGLRTISFATLLANDSVGPANESGQVLTVSSVNNAVGGTVSISGTNVLFTPGVDFNGTASFTYTARDNGTTNGAPDFLTSAPATVSFTVTAVNDAPTFTLQGNPATVNEDAGTQTVSNFAGNFQPGPPTAIDEAGQTLVGYTVVVTGTTGSLGFSSAPAITNAGALSYTTAPDTSGTATVSVVATDSGSGTPPNVNTSSAHVFTITVNPVNDAPSFTKGSDQAVNEDAGAQTLSAWASNISPGPADESGQTLSFAATNNNNALFATQPAVSASGGLTYTPAADQNGTATVTVRVSDNGGTANGGVDTSAPQTFTITVNAVNDAPSFTKGPDRIVRRNSGAQTFVNWATGISAGPANESGQTLTFLISGNTNSSLFAAGPTISPAGVLQFTPATGASGTATVTVVIKDNGGTANGGIDTSAPQSFQISILKGFEIFLLDHFTAAERNDPAISGPQADPNFNGIPNLLEYALGLDPRVGGGIGVTTGQVMVSGERYATLSYSKPAGLEEPDDLVYTPERTSSLVPASWSASPTDFVVVGTVPGPGNRETVTVRSTHPFSGTEREYLRLRVTLTP